MAKDIKQGYETRRSSYEKDLIKIKKEDNVLALMRGLIAIASVVFLIFGYLKDIPYFAAYIALPIFIFILIVVRHHGVRKKINFLHNLVQINKIALLRLGGKWNNFASSGKEFMNLDHPYTGDLNIFGQGSLYQYINATTFFMGEEALARLLSVQPCYQDIGPRQQAIHDLAGRLEWRQHFQATGMSSMEQNNNIKGLLNWAVSKTLLGDRKYLYLIWLLPVVTVILFLLMAYRLVPTYVPLIPLCGQVLLVTISQKFIYPVFRNTEKAALELERYQSLLSFIEREEFHAPLLVDLQRKLLICEQNASQQIKNLSKIAVLINFRYSVLYMFFNALTFCDFYTVWKLDKWKDKSGRFLENWFRVIGEYEALASLASLAHDNPEWVFPEITNDQTYFSATSLGHPLINKHARVCNDLSIPGPGSIHIITGSNMSGKSTLLRTVGINLVLAYTGAPVCAANMRCSLMRIYTSIRVEDNLEQNISVFYAELKRIKKVIDTAQEGRPLIFMLDEIFRGTNSNDRIFGARTVIKNLSSLSAIGFVTTHDLEISRLEEEYPGYIKNYHFTDQIINNEILFDYRLKEGVSSTTNAIALMKMIGIQI